MEQIPSQARSRSNTSQSDDNITDLLSTIKTMLQTIQGEHNEIKRELSDINDRLDCMVSSINAISTKLGAQMDSIEQTTSRMNDHISFVDDVYSMVSGAAQSIFPGLPNRSSSSQSGSSLLISTSY